MNISNVNNCYGCGVCAIVCAKKIICIELNSDGFYVPHISDATECTDCGLCIDVCAYSQEQISLEEKEIHSYAAWSKESKVRNKCSSGGVGFELGLASLKQGYMVCGVRYNAEKSRAEHYIASNVEELFSSIGSKYIQSYTVDGFSAVDRKKKYLITGSPCQIDSFRRYIRKFRVEDNFVLMDFFCHGVPSKFIWTKYLDEIETKVGKIVYASWRNKFTGWHDSFAIAIEGQNASFKSNILEGDNFYRLFFCNCCLGKACYADCKYKYDLSSADIRIGDAWGSKYADNEEGVSAVVTFTNRGNTLLHLCNVELVECPLEIVAEGQMHKRLTEPTFIRFLSLKLLSIKKMPISVVSLINRVYVKINRILK